MHWHMFKKNTLMPPIWITSCFTQKGELLSERQHPWDGTGGALFRIKHLFDWWYPYSRFLYLLIQIISLYDQTLWFNIITIIRFKDLFLFKSTQFTVRFKTQFVRFWIVTIRSETLYELQTNFVPRLMCPGQLESQLPIRITPISQLHHSLEFHFISR